MAMRVRITGRLHYPSGSADDQPNSTTGTRLTAGRQAGTFGCRLLFAWRIRQREAAGYSRVTTSGVAEEWW
ncbi:hypothetical protein LJR290_006961 [Variovorax sp. LjRoot290]|uniref:hypothetical protein n=1 Tax=unclassified Variovorax TaxID=663243 RepID=UPI003ECE44FE